MKTIAVIPALNEYQRLSEVVARTRLDVDHVLVVDDGSATPLSEHLVPTDHVTVLRHGINLGKGAALKSGVIWANRHGFEAAVFLDADGQHDPSEIPRLLAPITSDQADIVFGIRQFHGRMPLVARLGNSFLTGLMRTLYRINVADTQSGFRAIRLSVLDKLLWSSPRYGVETEIIVNTGKHHLRFTQVPISTIYHDKYKGTTVVDGIRIMLNMIVWRFL